jgi:predicted deacetylase
MPRSLAAYAITKRPRRFAYLRRAVKSGKEINMDGQDEQDGKARMNAERGTMNCKDQSICSSFRVQRSAFIVSLYPVYLVYPCLNCFTKEHTR